ncbi:MAG: endonuclease [Brumimicrobium sp.]|nr:endonuclease [Brumimicrobium sp.]
MNKKILSLFVAFSTAFFAFSQATLPTSCDFTGSALPAVGWSSNLAEYYTGSGNPAPAFKFGVTGRYLLINVASAPGNVTFDLTGNSFGTGSFELQESVDGTTFTTVATYGNAELAGGSYFSNNKALDQNSRWIRFIYINKAGGNVGLDNVVINKVTVTQQQMAVMVDGAQSTNNASYIIGANVGSNNILPFDVKNDGSVNALTINSIAISGADASEFSLNNILSFPLTINASSTENIGIDFTPTSAGTKNAVVTITSDDIDFPVFTFNLIGYGDNLATEPTEQATSLSFSDIKTYRFKGNFIASPNTDGYLILRKKGSPITEVPVDGTTYNAGDVIGGAKVLKSTNNTTFYPNDIIAGTDYYFAVFSYNGLGSGRNYLTTSPLTGNITTLTDIIPASDYSGINTSSSTLVSDLHDIIAPHFQNYYSDYAAKMAEKFYGRDTINGKRVVTCTYTGNNYQYDYPFNFANSGMSREHTYANSWFPVTDNNANYYSDYHNLLLVNQNDANAIRSNYPFGEAVSDVIQSVGGSKFGKDANGNWVYEPRDNAKGAVARAIFYMAVRYTENGQNWKLPNYISASIAYGQEQTILKQWNINFPPSNFEIARNDYIDSLQNNRNPFIDHPEYACFIDFSDMNHFIDGCGSLSITKEQLEQAFIVYPNPASETIYIAVDGAQLVSYRIVDMEGRIVKEEATNHVIAKEISISDLNKGMYFIQATTEYGEVSKKIVIE